MAEDHRRIESRGIVGTGMMTDPERIRDVEEEAKRKERSWRNAPERGFGDVLKDAPAHGELADADEEDPRKRKKPESPAVDAAMATEALAKPEVPAAVPAKAALPRVPRDPREEMLRKKLAAAQAAPKAGFQNDTPPTGSHKRKPSP